MRKLMLLVFALVMIAASVHPISAADRVPFDRDALEQVQKKLVELNVRGKIAFTVFSKITGKSRGAIYLVSATASKRITNDRVNAMAPAWSPDGKRIAFQSVRNGHYEMYTVNLDGAELTKLTTFVGPDDALGDGFPSWSPDGLKIVFESRRDGLGRENQIPEDAVHISEPNIVVMSSDGSDLTMLRNGHWPRWSPDGKKILFQSVGDKLFIAPGEPFPTMGIYVMNQKGRDIRRLTNQKADSLIGCWSPDGKQIAFTSNRDYEPHDVTNLDLYLMNADGSEPRRLTQSEGQKNCPSWSPDGEWIAFYQSSHKGRSSLWLIKPDGSNLTRLTGKKHDACFPTWCPAEKDR